MKNIYPLLFFLIVNSFLVAQNHFRINGGFVQVTGDVDLVLQNTTWTNNGTFSASDGTVYLTGNAAETVASIEGASTTSFYNLTINKSANNAQLGQHTIVSNQLSLENGNLDLKDYDLDLVGTYTLNNSHYVQTSGIGFLVQNVQNSASKDFPVGNDSYTPLALQNDGTTDDFYVRVTPEVLEDGTSGTPFTTDVVDRTWMVEEGITGGTNISLTATWNGVDELPAFDRTQCYLSHYTGGAWDAPAAAAASGADPYSISRSGITSLSPFAVGSNGALPIELLNFLAIKEGERVKLEWTTATELNNDFFTIERSIDGLQFEELERIAGAGTSLAPIHYETYDPLPQNGLNYYRLRQTDFDGTTTLSEIRVVLFTGPDSRIVVFPNPTADLVTLQAGITFESGTATVYSETGQFISESVLTPGNADHVLRFGHFPSGTYLLKIRLNQREYWEKVLVR